MPTRAHLYADQSDPLNNRHFRRRWSDQPMTARELQHAADLEMAHGNRQRADLLAWAAHAMRAGVEAVQ